MLTIFFVKCFYKFTVCIIIKIGDNMRKDFTYKSKDNITNIHAYIWEPTVPVKAIIQISHGMLEHILRYEEFANAMNKLGILVCGNDHLGHGRSVQDIDHQGYFADENSYQIVLEDLNTLKDKVIETYPNVPYYILGHSMGSFIARNFIYNYNENISGVIIMGSGYHSAAKMRIGKIIAAITQFYHHGWFYRSPFLEKITTGGFHKFFAKGSDKNCWLAKDPEVVKKFNTDPLCQFKFTCNGYATLFEFILKSINKKAINNLPKDLPILILSGKDDPVGHFGKDIYKIENTYEKCGLKDVHIKQYNGMRHELLNEKDRSIVYNDIVNFVLNKKGED